MMGVHLPLPLGDEIARAVLMGEDPGAIAQNTDMYVQDHASDHTFITYAALEYFIRESSEKPKKYLGITGSDIRAMIEGEAKRMEGTPLAKVVTSEFWSWSDFIECDFIAEVCNVIADAMVRFRGESRRRFR